MDSVEPVDLPSAPAQEVPEEKVGRFRGVLRTECSLERKPVVLVKILLFIVGQSHEEPVLDFLALGEGLPGRVQALEDLLGVLVRLETDAHYTKPGEALKQPTNVASTDEAAGNAPSLRDRTGTGRVPLETATVLLLVAMLEPKLAVLLGPLVGIGESMVPDCLRSPVAANTVRSQLLCDAGEKDADGGESLLSVNDPKGGHNTGGARLRKGKQGAAIVGCIGIGFGDRQEILDQPFDIRLSPAVPALPTRNDVLDLSVQKLKESDGVGMHVRRSFGCKEANVMVWRYWKTAGGYRTCFTDFHNRRPVVRCTLTLRLSDKFPHHLVCLTPYRTLQLCCFGVQARRLLGQVCDSVLLLRRQAADRDILNVARVKMGYGGDLADRETQLAFAPVI